jgi:hypothetical protein
MVSEDRASRGGGGNAERRHAARGIGKRNELDALNERERNLFAAMVADRGCTLASRT